MKISFSNISQLENNQLFTPIQKCDYLSHALELLHVGGLLCMGTLQAITAVLLRQKSPARVTSQICSGISPSEDLLI